MTLRQERDALYRAAQAVGEAWGEWMNSEDDEGQDTTAQAIYTLRCVLDDIGEGSNGRAA